MDKDKAMNLVLSGSAKSNHQSKMNTKPSGKTCPKCHNETFIDEEGDEVCYQCNFVLLDVADIERNAAMEALRSALSADGVTFGITQDEADKLLQAQLGKKRFRQFCRTRDTVRAGSEHSHAAYSLMRSVAEYNCLMSNHGDVLLATNAAVLSASDMLSVRTGRIAELGCGAGTVTKFLAQRLPGCQVVGFDRLPRILNDARRAAPSNCELHLWDYSCEPAPLALQFDRLFGSLCIDFKSSGSEVDPSDQESIVRETNRAVDSCGPCFDHWRSVASDGAECTVVLRIPSIYSFSGACQVAVLTGWQPEYNRFMGVSVGDEWFPVLTLRAGDPQIPPPGMLEKISDVWNVLHQEDHSILVDSHTI